MYLKVEGGGGGAHTERYLDSMRIIYRKCNFV